LLGNILVFLFNTVLLTITLILLFASPPYLDNYEEIFNWTGFIVSLILWILVEIYLRVPYFGYVTI